jgi:hypothetical protein
MRKATASLKAKSKSGRPETRHEGPKQGPKARRPEGQRARRRESQKVRRPEGERARRREGLKARGPEGERARMPEGQNARGPVIDEQTTAREMKAKGKPSIRPRKTKTKTVSRVKRKPTLQEERDEGHERTSS